MLITGRTGPEFKQAAGLTEKRSGTVRSFVVQWQVNVTSIRIFSLFFAIAYHSIWSNFRANVKPVFLLICQAIPCHTDRGSKDSSNTFDLHLEKS